MEAFLHDLPALVSQYGYLMVALIVGVLLASGFGLPFPEDVPLLAAGVLCHLEVMSLWTMIPLVFAAVLGADCCLYFLGRRYGHVVQRLPFLRRYLTQERLAKAQLAFHNHGGKSLFIGRFLPGLRAPIFFSAGVFKIPFWKMLAFDGAAALISVPALVLLAYFFTSQVVQIKEKVAQTQMLVLAVTVLIVGGIVAWKLMRRRRIAATGAGT
jgi:membrane protein DedA with SNARE-associated domain